MYPPCKKFAHILCVFGFSAGASPCPTVYGFRKRKQIPGRGRCPHRPETLSRKASVPAGASPCPTVYGFCKCKQVPTSSSPKNHIAMNKPNPPSIETSNMRRFSFSENLRFSECTLLSSVCCKFFL